MEKLTLEEILERFQNGEQRYDTIGYFKEAVTAIHSGVGIYAVLDRVLKEHVILMHLYNGEFNKNQVAVGECARLTDEVLRWRKCEKFLDDLNKELLDDNKSERLEKQKLIDKVLSLTEALQHFQK